LGPIIKKQINNAVVLCTVAVELNFTNTIIKAFSPDCKVLKLI